MARYWFHIICQGQPYPDSSGHSFDTPDDALAHAATIARELALDSTYEGCAVRVLDERGGEVGLLRVGKAEA